MYGAIQGLTVSVDGLSPAEAVEKIRAAKLKGDKSAWTVYVKKGVYNFKTPLVFTPADSGSVESPVKWIGEEGAIFSGGGKIEDWRDDGNGVWSAPIPVNEKGEKIFFESLYVNGRRADRSRFPEKGELKFAKWKERGVINGAVTNYFEEFTIKGPEPKFLAGLSREELDAVQCRIFVKWSYGAYPVESYTSSNGMIAVCGNVPIASWKRWNEDKHNYLFFENVAAGFTKPGQWFYDVKAGRVKYRPLKGETIESFEAIAPTSRLVSIVELKGDLDKGEFVHDISFENIAFTASRTDGEVTKNGAIRQYQLQAARSAGAAVYSLGAHRVKFERCRVFNTENYAFKFDDGCVSNVVRSCEIYDAGAGGIWVGNNRQNMLKMANEKWRNLREPWNHPFVTKSIVDTSTKAVRFNVVDNNLITHCGRVNPEGCGIVLTHAADTKVTHNEITDIYYTGISVGWTWGYWGSYGQRNEISFNLIKNIGQGRMSDMGGVYTLAASFGTVVTNNVIMDVKSRSYGGWGMYNDEGSEGVHWENNLVVNTSADSYHLHFGRNNKVVNCVMINGGTSKLCVSRAEKHNQITFARNIVYWKSGPVFVRAPSWNKIRDGLAKVKWNNNLFWCESGVTELNGPVTGTVGDPGFVAPENGDWRLKKNSPALKLGFKPWDYSLSGRRK
ncbi:MAG: right-handed parallel beta-helix repeat-containing protein [Kiritimatiellae bacterium]|nr:right-handed parallel beta-helix repeat-containing protein [Kiritimatiellia bacterium]